MSYPRVHDKFTLHLSADDETGFQMTGSINFAGINVIVATI